MVINAARNFLTGKKALPYKSYFKLLVAQNVSKFKKCTNINQNFDE